MSTSARTGTAARMEAVLRAFFSGINTHDVSAINQICASDCKFVDPATEVTHDLNAYLRLSAEYFGHFPDVQWEILYLLVEAGAVCAVYRCTGTGQGEWPEGVSVEGLRHEMVEVLIATVVDGRVTRIEFHIDLDELRRQPWNR